MSIWKLSCDAPSLRRLSLGEVIAAIWVRRQLIRYHRDQKGDNRCWLDDWFVWQLLSDTPRMPRYLPGEGMAKCEEFFEHRRSEGPDTAPRGIIWDAAHWDDDLFIFNKDALDSTLLALQIAIAAHRDVGDHVRSADDDRALYDVLPERIPADLTLPPREAFLGCAAAPRAGCPSFWASHEQCNPSICSLHRWGPCR